MTLSWNQIGLIRLALEAHAENLRNMYEWEDGFEHPADDYEDLASRLDGWAKRDETEAVDYLLVRKDIQDLKAELYEIEKELDASLNSRRLSSPGL